MWLISGSLHQKSANLAKKQNKKTTILIYSHTHKVQNAHEATANCVFFFFFKELCHYDLSEIFC